MKFSKENWCGKSQKEGPSSRSTKKHLSKLANACSLFCSAVGTSLVASILFGPKSIGSYRNVQLASSCATGLLVAAFLLGVLGAVLSFKKDSKNNNSNAIKGKVRDTFKVNEIKTAKSLVRDEAIAINSKKLINQKISSDALVDDLRRRSVTESDRLAKEANIPEDPFKSKATALPTEKDGFPIARDQLVPVKRQHDIAPFQHCVTNMVYSDTPYRWNLVSKDKGGMDSMTEVVATKRVRFFSGDYANRQEEYEVRQTTTFFKYPRLGSSSCKISEISFDPQIKQDKVFHSSEGTTKSLHLSDVVSKFESLHFKH